MPVQSAGDLALACEVSGIQKGTVYFEQRSWVVYERVMSWIMDALEIWLGFTQPYARLEVAQAGFEADRVIDYCPCCGSSVGRGEVHVWKERLCCTACRYRVHAVTRVIRLGPYSAPLRPWILQIKFHRWEPLAKELGRCLAQQVQDYEEHYA